MTSRALVLVVLRSWDTGGIFHVSPENDHASPMWKPVISQGSFSDWRNWTEGLCAGGQDRVSFSSVLADTFTFKLEASAPEVKQKTFVLFVFMCLLVVLWKCVDMQQSSWFWFCSNAIDSGLMMMPSGSQTKDDCCHLSKMLRDLYASETPVICCLRNWQRFLIYFVMKRHFCAWVWWNEYMFFFSFRIPGRKQILSQWRSVVHLFSWWLYCLHWLETTVEFHTRKQGIMWIW